MTQIKFQQPRMSRFFESNSNHPAFKQVLSNMLKNEYSYGENQSAVNVSETEKEYVIEYLVPGFKKEEIKVALENNLLTVSAETKTEESTESKRYTRKEFTSKSFSRAFTLPENIDADRLEAKQENGILMITIPKKVEEKKEVVKEIEIK